MLKFIIKKLLMMIPMLLLISFIVYFGLQLTGIDPINFMVSPEMLSANKENVEALRESLGSDIAKEGFGAVSAWSFGSDIANDGF